MEQGTLGPMSRSPSCRSSFFHRLKKYWLKLFKYLLDREGLNLWLQTVKNWCFIKTQTTIRLINSSRLSDFLLTETEYLN